MNKKLAQPKPLKSRKGSYRVRGDGFTTNPGGGSMGGGGSGSGGGGESLSSKLMKEVYSVRENTQQEKTCDMVEERGCQNLAKKIMNEVCPIQFLEP